MPQMRFQRHAHDGLRPVEIGRSRVDLRRARPARVMKEAATEAASFLGNLLGFIKFKVTGRSSLLLMAGQLKVAG
jgi:hypothetical protein